MAEEMVSFRGMRVSADWPRRLRDAQLSTTCRRNGVEIGRVRYGDERHAWGAGRRPCHDCAAARGEFYVPGCDVEECPVCGGQMLGGCDCEGPDDEEEE